MTRKGLYISKPKVRKATFLPLYLFTLLLFLASCSMTKNLPEDEQLFVGLTKIAYADDREYDNEEYDKHLENTKLEIEAALATKPNGSLFGLGKTAGTREDMA